jgi:hypothetical protein
MHVAESSYAEIVSVDAKNVGYVFLPCINTEYYKNLYPKDKKYLLFICISLLRFHCNFKKYLFIFFAYFSISFLKKSIIQYEHQHFLSCIYTFIF